MSYLSNGLAIVSDSLPENDDCTVFYVVESKVADRNLIAVIYVILTEHLSISDPSAH